MQDAHPRQGPFFPGTGLQRGTYPVIMSAAGVITTTIGLTMVGKPSPSGVGIDTYSATASLVLGSAAKLAVVWAFGFVKRTVVLSQLIITAGYKSTSGGTPVNANSNGPLLI